MNFKRFLTIISVLCLNLLFFTSNVFAATPTDISTSQYFTSTQTSADWGIKTFGYTLTYYASQWEDDSYTYQIVADHDFFGVDNTNYINEIGSPSLTPTRIELLNNSGTAVDYTSSFSGGTIRTYVISRDIGLWHSYTSLFGNPIGSYRIKTTSITTFDGFFPGGQTDTMYTSYF